jgi:RimJ/RimL family protein N-acetyltransferase
VPLDAAQHGDALWSGTGGAGNESLWRYMGEGPFPDRAAFDAHLRTKAASDDPLFYALVDQAAPDGAAGTRRESYPTPPVNDTRPAWGMSPDLPRILSPTSSGRALGYAALMRIEPKHRVIEVGNIVYARALQRTRGATEAMYLLARYVFEDLGYRRYEWKCDALNEPSRRAALRLGFSFEGVFRQHMTIKGRNRDTAWFSILDSEWPLRKHAFERWLAPSNFDPEGRQKTSLRTKE